MLNINNLQKGEQRNIFEQTNRKSYFTPYLATLNLCTEVMQRSVRVGVLYPSIIVDIIVF